jgi:hypothetical protein
MSDDVAAVNEQPVSLRSLTRPGLQAIRRNWAPFVLFQAGALLLVIGYFRVDAIHQFCQYLSAMKQAWGLLFSAAAAAIAGVVFPEIAKAVLPVPRAQAFSWRDFVIDLLFFAGSGMTIDLQYRFFAVLLGNGMDLGTVIRKVLVDQFITTPLYGVPYWNLVYAWKSNGFRIRPTLAPISPRWYLTTVLPLLLSAWFYWIPMTLMVYSLPGPLQFSLYALAMAAWSLIMIFVADHKRSAVAGDEAGLPAPAQGARDN